MKILACDNCGAIIHRCPSKIRYYNVFCSQDCMNEYHKRMNKTIDKCNESATIISDNKLCTTINHSFESRHIKMPFFFIRTYPYISI